jgi:hypothetical protein
MIVAGGEGFGKAWNNVDVCNGLLWHSWDSLQVGRHGTGLSIDCSATEYRDHIYIASGAASQGGGFEVRSTEVYLPNRTMEQPVDQLEYLQCRIVARPNQFRGLLLTES